MTLIKKLTVNSKEYTVTLRRFDDIVAPQYNAEYHGYYIDIQSQHATVIARNYDNEDVVIIQNGVNPENSTLVEDIRQIAKELFGTNRLELLTSDSVNPYQTL